VECLAATVNAKTVPEDEISSIWVMRYDAPGTFVDAAKAWYLRSEDMRSPMGMNLAAFETEAQYTAAAKQHEGLQYRWLGLRLLVAKEWE
jgi:copper chaperone NosL